MTNGRVAAIFTLLIWTITFPVGKCIGATVVASDDANDPAYANGWYATGDGTGQPATNGGFGFQPWEVAEDTGQPGLMFLDTSSDRVSGSQSFAIDGGADGFGLFRPLSSPLTYGTFNVSIRFDSSSVSGGSDFNIDGGNKFLLSVEMTPGLSTNELEILDGSQHYLRFATNSSAPLVGDVLNFSTTFNTNTGTYLLNVTDETVPRTASFAGNLQFQGLPVNEFFLGTGQFGTQGQVMDFDSLSVTVPEPSSLVLAASTVLFGLMRTKRMRANYSS